MEFKKNITPSSARGGMSVINLAFGATIGCNFLLHEVLRVKTMIVGVAIRIGDHIEVRLPKPNRHCNCFEYFYKLTGKRAPELELRTGGENQGFYTHTGKYLNRKQAIKYVKRIKQEVIGTPHAYLFSEDLW